MRYQAPAVIKLGNVNALTASAKCTPGTDSGMAHASNNSGNYNQPMFYLPSGEPVPTGTDCLASIGHGFNIPFKAR